MTPPSSDRPTPSRRAAAELRRARVDRAVEAFQAGRDRDASFRVLVEAYRPVVEGYVRRRVSSAADHDDLIQEVFLGIYKGLDGFRGDSRFGTWAFQIARNVVLQWYRRRRSRPETDLEVLRPPDEQRSGQPGEPEIPDPEQTAPDEAALSEEQRRLLRRAIAGLPDQMRRATALRILHGLKYREVAATMRLSVGAVKAHVAQARRRLHDELGHQPDAVQKPDEDGS